LPRAAAARTAAVTEIASEKNSAIVFPLPLEMLHRLGGLGKTDRS